MPDERARHLTTKNAMDWLGALSAHGLDGDAKKGVFIRRVADIAADTLRVKDDALARAENDLETMRAGWAQTLLDNYPLTEDDAQNAIDRALAAGASTEQPR